jgi:hypothetical protein
MSDVIVRVPTTVCVVEQPVSFAVVINRGEKGDPGSGGGGSVSLPSLLVAQSLSALRIVANLNGQYDYANPLDPIAAWSIAGISLQSINASGLLTPVNNQPVSDQSWNWVRGSPVFLGPLGTLTQTPPSTGSLVTVARVLDPKTLFIHIEDAIRL